MWGRGYGKGGRGNSHLVVSDWLLTDRFCWEVGDLVCLSISEEGNMLSLMYVFPSARDAALGERG